MTRDLRPVSFRVSAEQAAAIDAAASGLSRGEFARRATLAAAGATRPEAMPTQTRGYRVEYDESEVSRGGET